MKKHFKAVELKYLDEETIMKIREWRNQPFIRNMMYSQHEITEEEHRKYIDSMLKDETRGLFVFYLDDEPFGVVNYTILSKGDKVYLGNYLVEEEYQYLGYGTLLGYFECEIARDVLKCDKLCFEILEGNEKAFKNNKKFGMEIEDSVRKGEDLEGQPINAYKCVINMNESSQYKKVRKLVFRVVEEFDYRKDVIY